MDDFQAHIDRDTEKGLIPDKVFTAKDEFDARVREMDLEESQTQFDFLEPSDNVHDVSEGKMILDEAGEPTSFNWMFLLPTYDRPLIGSMVEEGEVREQRRQIPTWRFEYLLQRLAFHGHQGKACKEACISSVTLSFLRKQCPVFMEAYELAKKTALTRLEDLATEMSHSGDAQMVRFLLTKRMMEVYGDKTQLELKQTGSPLNHMLGSLSMLKKNERESLRELIGKASGPSSEAAG